MGHHSGLVNFHRMEKTAPWSRDGSRHTFVYAFWLVDYERAEPDEPDEDAGVEVLKDENEHPDWFLHADTADQVLTAYLHAGVWASPNWSLVFGEDKQAVPLLGSMLVGTSDGMYRSKPGGQLWWCGFEDLTWKGSLLMSQLNLLYERRAILVTFLDKPTDENTGPRDSR